jgi:dTDP-4-amino-4,6-dideoxygalactose transaminase
VAHYVVTGVGGLALTNDPDLAVRLRSLMNHGRDSIYIKIDDDQGVSGAELHEIVSRRFSFVSMGHSFRCTEFEGALGLAQLEQKDRIIRARQKNARILTKGLEDLKDHLQLPASPEERPHMFMMYPIVLRNEGKTGLVNFLEDHGIETRDLLPMINQPVYRQLFGDLEPGYPAARWLNHGGFYVGCHPLLTTKDLEKIVETVHRYFRR